MEDKKLNGTA